MVRKSRPEKRYALARGGFTLVELMVSVTLTLLVVFAIVDVFDMMGKAMTKTRATIEMAGSLRSVANQLQADLDEITCDVRPWLDPDRGEGYFLYIEGRAISGPAHPIQEFRYRNSDRDGAYEFNFSSNTFQPRTTPPVAIGDRDDILMFTSRSESRPFRGQTPTGHIESKEAEIIWWISVTNAGNFRLHRRTLLIRPDLNMLSSRTDLNPNDRHVLPGTDGGILTPFDIAEFFNAHDISARVVVNDAGEPVALAANSLGHLTTPRNRFGHYPISDFRLGVNWNPGNSFVPSSLPDTTLYELDPRYLMEFRLAPHNDVNPFSLVLNNGVHSTNRLGDDVLLSGVLAFDVKAYSPNTPLDWDPAGNIAMAPHDPGYDFVEVNSQLLAGTPLPHGAYVDLHYLFFAPSVSMAGFGVDPLAAAPDPPKAGTAAFYVSYDTWSMGLERDGLNQDDHLGPDQATNLVDDQDFSNTKSDGVDDYGERETRPPYNVSLPGIEVTIRAIEQGTQQVRQVSVIGDFQN